MTSISSGVNMSVGNRLFIGTGPTRSRCRLSVTSTMLFAVASVLTRVASNRLLSRNVVRASDFRMTLIVIVENSMF